MGQSAHVFPLAHVRVTLHTQAGRVLEQPLDPAESPAVYALVRAGQLAALLTPQGGVGVGQAA